MPAWSLRVTPVLISLRPAILSANHLTWWLIWPAHEWAELWINADRQNGYKAAKHEPDPFLLFNSGPTMAEVDRQIESFVDIHGAPVPVTKVASVREEAVRKWFPKAAAERLIALVKQAATATGSELTAAFSDIEPAVANTFVKRLLLA